MSTDKTPNHDTRTDIEITLRPGTHQSSVGKEPCWFAEADGYRNVSADSASEALSMVGEQIDNGTLKHSFSEDPRRSSALFANDDSNPFAISSPNDYPETADLLQDIVDHLTVTVMGYLANELKVKCGDLHSLIRLVIRETYNRRGFAHNQPSAELGNQSNPTPEDFSDTLEDIINDPKQYDDTLDCSPAIDEMEASAVRLAQLLSEAKDWEKAASQPIANDYQRHRNTTTEGVAND